MRGQKKPKRVTWASDANLCQVKLFLSEDPPSQVGLGAQDHLQAKISLPLRGGILVSDDNLPPGFEGAQPASRWKNKLAQIPVIKWSRPPSHFSLNPDQSYHRQTLRSEKHRCENSSLLETFVERNLT